MMKTNKKAKARAGEVLHEYCFPRTDMGIRNMEGTINMVKRLYGHSKQKVVIKKWYRQSEVQVKVKAA